MYLWPLSPRDRTPPYRGRHALIPPLTPPDGEQTMNQWGTNRVQMVNMLCLWVHRQAIRGGLPLICLRRQAGIESLSHPGESSTEGREIVIGHGWSIVQPLVVLPTRTKGEQTMPKQGQFQCTCGEIFSQRWQLSQHIALSNPHWPRSSPEDTHFATGLSKAIEKMIKED